MQNECELMNNELISPLAGSRNWRQRSRSPASQVPARRNVAHAGASAAVFQQAIRQVVPEAVKIKQELFPSSAVPLGPTSALDRKIKHEKFTATAAGIPSRLAGAATMAPFSGHADSSLNGSSVAMELDSVVVMNIHFDATPEQLGMHFHERCGSVVRVTILKNAHGMPKGYAYMQLTNNDAVLRAQGLSGTEFMGRTLRVLCHTLHHELCFSDLCACRPMPCIALPEIVTTC
jgi:hypothetical protein